MERQEIKRWDLGPELGDLVVYRENGQLWAVRTAVPNSEVNLSDVVTDPQGWWLDGGDYANLLVAFGAAEMGRN